MDYSQLAKLTSNLYNASPEKDDILSWLSSIDWSRSQSATKESLSKLLINKNDIIKQISQNPVFKDILIFLRTKIEEKQLTDEQFSPIKLRSPIRSPISSTKKKNDEVLINQKKKVENLTTEIATKKKKLERLRRSLKDKSMLITELNIKKKQLQDQNHFYHFKRNMILQFDLLKEVYTKFLINNNDGGGGNDNSINEGYNIINTSYTNNAYDQAAEANQRIQEFTNKTKGYIENFRIKNNVRFQRNSIHSLKLDNEGQYSSVDKKVIYSGQQAMPNEIIEFLNVKKQRYWDLFELNNKKLKDLAELKQKYQEKMDTLDKLLSTQEPYLKDKIKNHIKKTINLNQKRILKDFLQNISMRLKTNSQKISMEVSLNRGIDGTVDNIRKQEGNAILVKIEDNRKLLKSIHASKIRVSEFIANYALKAINDIIQMDINIHKLSNINLKYIESLDNIPLDCFYTNKPYQSFAPVLSKIMNKLPHPNRLYFYIPNQIWTIADKILKYMMECELLAKLKSKQSKKAWNNLQLEAIASQNSKKKQLSELQNYLEILETESNLVKNLETQLVCYRTQEAQFFVEFLTQHNNKPISYYVNIWRETFQDCQISS